MPSSANRVNYSASEQRLIALLRKLRKKISTTDLLAQVYGKALPFNARQIIGERLRTIRRKALHNKEDWTIERSERAGPHAVSWWIEK